jgi:hypothetical protein
MSRLRRQLSLELLDRGQCIVLNFIFVMNVPSGIISRTARYLYQCEDLIDYYVICDISFFKDHGTSLCLYVLCFSHYSAIGCWLV